MKILMRDYLLLFITSHIVCSQIINVAIVGGGLGGLGTAKYLYDSLKNKNLSLNITILEQQYTNSSDENDIFSQFDGSYYTHYDQLVKQIVTDSKLPTFSWFNGQIPTTGTWNSDKIIYHNDQAQNFFQDFLQFGFQNDNLRALHQTIRLKYSNFQKQILDPSVNPDEAFEQFSDVVEKLELSHLHSQDILNEFSDDYKQKVLYPAFSEFYEKYENINSLSASAALLNHFSNHLSVKGGNQQLDEYLREYFTTLSNIFVIDSYTLNDQLKKELQFDLDGQQPSQLESEEQELLNQLEQQRSKYSNFSFSYLQGSQVDDVYYNNSNKKFTVVYNESYTDSSFDAVFVTCRLNKHQSKKQFEKLANFSNFRFQEYQQIAQFIVTGQLDHQYFKYYEDFPLPEMIISISLWSQFSSIKIIPSLQNDGETERNTNNNTQIYLIQSFRNLSEIEIQKMFKNGNYSVLGNSSHYVIDKIRKRDLQERIIPNFQDENSNIFNLQWIDHVVPSNLQYKLISSSLAVRLFKYNLLKEMANFTNKEDNSSTQEIKQKFQVNSSTQEIKQEKDEKEEKILIEL